MDGRIVGLIFFAAIIIAFAACGDDTEFIGSNNGTADAGSSGSDAAVPEDSGADATPNGSDASAEEDAEADMETCTPEAEVCDGVDNDCDDAVDEDFPTLSDACTAGMGVCAQTGELVCDADGADVECSVTGDDTMMSAELCDGLDNDCDGTVDEDFPQLGTACTAGMGVCEATGTFVCAADGSGVECDAMPDSSAMQTEVCDGLDNDCDGSVDEGCDDDGDGFCDNTLTFVNASSCPNGPGDCNDTDAAINPGAQEVCDGVDNDCDSTIDEPDADDATQWFADCDGDGFAPTGAITRTACNEPSAAQTQCGTTTAGWVTIAPTSQSNTDCADSDSRAYPGQGQFFTTQVVGAASADRWDFDCDGVATREFTRTIASQPTSCSCPATILSSGWTTPVPACGNNGTYAGCRGGIPATVPCESFSETRTQSCR